MSENLLSHAERNGGFSNSVREVIARNLPTFAGLYKGYTEVKMPGRYDLLVAANSIVTALESAGFEIIRKA